MDPGVVHLHLIRGSTFEQVFRYKRRPAPGAAAEPVDLSAGWVAQAHIRRKPADSDPAFVFDSRAGEPHDGTIALDDEGTIALDATDEETLAAGELHGYWSLRLTPPDGKAFVLLAGEAVIGPAVTR